SAEDAGIADLTAAFGVERRAIEHDRAARAALEPLDRMAVGVVERRDGAVELEPLVAVELGRLIEGRRPAPACREPARLAGALALRGHVLLEAGLVDREAALARDVRGQVDREAVRIVEPEHGLARDHALPAEPRDRVLEKP